MSSDIAIVVVPRDRYSTFPRCLEALYAHTDVPFRLVVAVGGADSRTKEFLQQLQLEKGNVELVFVDRLLLQGEARNIAIRQSDERFCVVLENDTIVHKHWLAPLIECMREEDAAVVMPLILWYRGIHAAGCMFEERVDASATRFRHRIVYDDIRRQRIDYPECHCVLIDRRRLSAIEIFDDVEPFDVDLGLTLRKLGLSAFVEPSSVVTYSSPPPWEVRDVPAFKFRWNAATWVARNKLFMKKWGVMYDPSPKRASYRRQYLKLGLARWIPNRLTIWLSNLGVGSVKRLQTLIVPGHPHGPS